MQYLTSSAGSVVFSGRVASLVTLASDLVFRFMRKITATTATTSTAPRIMKTSYDLAGISDTAVICVVDVVLVMLAGVVVAVMLAEVVVAAVVGAESSRLATPT